MTRIPADFTSRYLAKIIDSSDDAIVTKDLNSIIQLWNASAERMFGYTAAEAIGQSIRMIIPDDRQSEEDFVLGQIKAGHHVRHYETIRRRKDGTTLPISLTVSPVFDEAGVVIGASKIARDISDRKHADVVARRLAAVVESSDDAIVSKDLNSIITSWNRGAERMFGYTASEAVGRSIRMIIPPDLQSEEDMVLARIHAGATVDHYETRRLRKDGSELQVSLTVSPIIDEAGVIVGASKIARDVTERSRLHALTVQQATISLKLSEVGSLVASSLDRETIVQKVTDAATALTEAEFGAFFYNVRDAQSGEAFMLYTLAGAPKEAFTKFPHPRATEVFAPTFHGEGTRPPRGCDERSALRPESAVLRHAGRTPARPQLPRRAGQSGDRRSAGRLVLRSFPAGRLHGVSRATGERGRRLGLAGPGECPSVIQRRAKPTA